MTDLLAPVLRRGSAEPDGARRPLALNAVLAGVAAPAVALLLLWAVGLVGWFAADGGSHGSTRSVLRVATDGWLLAHGAHLDLGDGVVLTASPLGLTAACAYLVFRLGRWAGATSEVDDLRTAVLGSIVLGGSYGLFAMVSALLASTATVAPGLKLAFLGGALMGALAGGCGMLRGAGLAGRLRHAVPVAALSALYGAVVVVAAMVAAGALLTTVAVSVRGQAVANVAEGLELDLVGGVFSLLLVLAIAPNVVLLAASYLLGTGFAVGAGTVVSPQEVTLGAVPSVPVLGALPPEAWTPAWALLLLAVPVLAALAAGHLTGRLLPTVSYTEACARGLAAGALGSLAVALATAQAGGAIGPGRMAETGAGFLAVLSAALLALAPAAAAGALTATWWHRRSDAAAVDDAADVEPTAPARVPAQRGAVDRAADRPAGTVDEDTVPLLGVRMGVRRGRASPED